jgi:Icc-related predicted phosphoesterase
VSREVRIAAVGDVHVGVDAAGLLKAELDGLADQADVLLIAGDLTHRGRPEEAAVLAADLRDVGVPVIAVLGNHDYHTDQQDAVTAVLVENGITVLEGAAAMIQIGGVRLGVAGTKGFGGGFAGRTASEFGEPEQRAFVALTRRLAGSLEQALTSLDTDVKVALMHFSPVAETLIGEPPEIHAFLGTDYLAEAVDRGGADLALHGHAHRGSRTGTTAGGVPVRNVAKPVIGCAYEVFCLTARERDPATAP